MAVRDTLASLADRLGLLDRLSDLRPHLPRSWLTILTYHRVFEPPAGYRFDEDVADVTPADFDQQMALLARECTPIDLRRLRRFFEGEPLPEKPVLVTFDDGYRDNYEAALPVLRKHGICAVFFIATRFIDERRLFWWDRISYLIKSATRSRFTIRYPALLEFDLPREQDKAIRILLRIIKTQYRLDLPRLLDEVAAASGAPLGEQLERAFADELLMTWPQIRTLHGCGMAVQSHTHSHRPLFTMTGAELCADLEISRRILTEQVGAAPDALALPVGRSIDALRPVQRALAGAGYRLCFANDTGVVPLWHALDPLQLPRVATEAGMPLASFRAAVHVPTPAVMPC